MKTKRIIVTMLVICGLVVGIASEACAASWWFTCQVITAGVNSSSGVTEFSLMRVDTADTRTFYAPAGQEKEMLAIALTALSAGLNVKAKVAWAHPLTNIESLHLDSGN